MKRYLIVLCILILSTIIFAQDIDYYFNPITVTATRYPALFSGVNRRVTVIDSVELAAMPGYSLQDVLTSVVGVDMQRRGPLGVQAEAGIRGGSFEETLVLVDGMAVNDPQTAHHNFDLPVSLQDVDHIEVLHGQGSGLYGADALTGVIHVITKNSTRRSVNAYSGQYGLVGGGMVIGAEHGKVSDRLSLSTSRSDGYTPYTEFEQVNVLNRSGFKWEGGKLDLQAGYNRKNFGANSFYSTAFPDEHETTETLRVSAAIDQVSGAFSFSPRLSWKQHKDDFILDNSRPEWYRNRHTSQKFVMQLPVYYKNDTGLWGIGGQLKDESINSSNLGDHERRHGGVFASWSSPVWRGLQCNGNVYLYHYEDWGWKRWPSIDASWQLHKHLKFYAAAGESFRIPSFTDLYYVSPANMGNPDLRYSQARSMETGLVTRYRKVRTGISVYSRQGRNVIDWTRQRASDPWQVTNITELNTVGIESDIRVTRPFNPVESLYLGYSWIDSDKKAMDYSSKYALNYLRYHAQLGFRVRLTRNLYTNWQFQWKKRINQQAYGVCDGGLSWGFNNRLRVNVNALNLFNADYTEIDGVPMPGRWLSAGIDMDFK